MLFSFFFLHANTWHANTGTIDTVFPYQQLLYDICSVLIASVLPIFQLSKFRTFFVHLLLNVKNSGFQPGFHQHGTEVPPEVTQILFYSIN